MIKGKILLFVSFLIMLILTACAAGAGYFAGIALEEVAGSTFLIYDWNVIKLVITVVCALPTFLLTIPPVITARQVNRMYKVSRKYAKWSPVTIIVGLLMLIVTGGCIGGVVYGLQSVPTLLMNKLLSELFNQTGISIDLLTIQIGFGVHIFVTFLLLFLPLLISLRGRDSVSAMLRKKRTYSDDEE